MIEIRPIRREEGDEFLRVMCDAFDLNFGRSRSVFFQEPLFELGRKWALFDRGRVVSVLTTSPLTFGWGRAIGIAGVSTVEHRRGEGLGARLLRHVLTESEIAGEGAALLFARDRRLYENVGFTQIDVVERAEIELSNLDDMDVEMPFGEARSIYDNWSHRLPNRLRRDERRWSYWNWHMRLCRRFRDGYVCVEGGTVRELISQSTNPWPRTLGNEWFGLSGMRKSMGLCVNNPQVELMLMAYRFPGQPEMFMTDQF